MEQVNLKTFAGGALQEKFDRAFYEVLQNMQDLNTPYKTKRVITITIGLTQTEQRDTSSATIEVKTKTAPASPIETHFAIGKDIVTGQVHAEEYGKQIKGQMNLEEIEIAKGYDPSTGEIYDMEDETQEQDDNIVNLRTAR